MKGKGRGWGGEEGMSRKVEKKKKRRKCIRRHRSLPGAETGDWRSDKIYKSIKYSVSQPHILSSLMEMRRRKMRRGEGVLPGKAC